MPALITWWTQDVATLSPRADPSDVASVGADLLDRWTEPHRSYHGTQHLVEMFWALEELTDAGELGDEAATLGRIAAWWHDAVYDPSAAPGANEAASAALASESLPHLGFRGDDVDAAVALVRMTADHAVRADDALQRAFHDADLWILAAPAERFDAYCDQVREEYAAVPDPLFRAARADILRNLVAEDGIYLVPHAQAQWELRARVNLDRELARLS